MPWAKLDDRIDENPKVLSVSIPARWLYVCGLAYCARNLSDGYIPRAALPRIAGDLRHLMKLVAELLVAVLWEERSDGYQVHDWGQYNRPAATIKAERERARERMANVRGAVPPNEDTNKRRTFGKRSPLPVPVPEPVPIPEPVPEPKPNPLPPPAANGGRVRDEIFEAILSVCGWRLLTLTTRERGRANQAAKEMREVQATAPLIRGFAIQWRDHYPTATLTPQAIVNNWSDYMAGKLAESSRARR
jgi:hypothetical protein